MSHDHFKKSTKENVIKIIELLREGKSTAEVGRIMKIDHTSVIYWRDKIGPNNIFVDNFFPENVIIKVYKKEKPAEEKIICQFCKGKKDKKWKTTGHCCMLAWHKANEKNRSNFYW